MSRPAQLTELAYSQGRIAFSGWGGHPHPEIADRVLISSPALLY